MLAHLTGETPDYLQGMPFLGAGKKQRELVYGTRDRVDEVFDCARSVRDKRWLYIRNHRPDLGWGQPSVFSDLGEIRAAIRENSKTPAQKHFTDARRPIEEFYDCQADPHNQRNLALEVMRGDTLKQFNRMRNLYAQRRKEIGDCGALPEGEMRRWISDEGAPMRDIVTGRTGHAPDLDAAWAAADKVGRSGVGELLQLLNGGTTPERYWAIIGLRCEAFEDARLHDRVADWLDDTAPSVRIETASWLAHFPEHHEAALARLAGDLAHEDWAVALRACRAIELLGERAASLKPTMRALYDRTRHAKGDSNFFLAFSSGAYLDKLGEKTVPWDFTPGAGSFMPPKKKPAKK